MQTQVKALKVKIKSLTAEAKIIRLEEKKAIGRKVPDLALYVSLREHRTSDVRREQRAALLAYAFIRGKPYAGLESPKSSTPDLSRVRQLVEKFGSRPRMLTKCHIDTINEWFWGSLKSHPFAAPVKTPA